ncbi:ABC transporter permease [Paenibacillus sanguinis]|uniref:ABC transporter permease n=1 Tax=Paenibacillus sanguinis TaxID=225906 RepID=UPI000363F002|nr:ABC transporter permease [Paenibacillus sanguinis]
MFKIYSAFKALKKRWVISILLLIQFTYGLSTITGSVNIFYNLLYLKNSSFLDLNSTYLVTPDGSLQGVDEKKFSKEQIDEVYQKMKNNQYVISYGTYYEDNIILDTSNRPLNRKMLAELTKTNYNMKEPSINAIVIDENYNRLLNMQAGQGTEFTSQDFKKSRSQQTNVLVGSYFKKYFRIGDVLNHQYKIIGFLPKKYIVNNNTSNLYLKLDKAMLIPMPEDTYNHYGSMFIRLHLGTIVQLRQGAELDQLNQTIQLQGSDVKLYLKSLGEEVNQNIISNAYTEIPQIVLGLSFILFSVIGIVVTTMVSIMIRKREFGIRMVLGESKYGIFSQITLENLLIGMVGMGLSLGHFAWKYNGLLRYSSELNLASPLDYKLNIPVLLSVFLILFLITLISNFFVFLFIKNMEPKSLIGGME